MFADVKLRDNQAWPVQPAAFMAAGRFSAAESCQHCLIQQQRKKSCPQRPTDHLLWPHHDAILLILWPHCNSEWHMQIMYTQKHVAKSKHKGECAHTWILNTLQLYKSSLLKLNVISDSCSSISLWEVISSHNNILIIAYSCTCCLHAWSAFMLSAHTTVTALWARAENRLLSVCSDSRNTDSLDFRGWVGFS